MCTRAPRNSHTQHQDLHVHSYCCQSHNRRCGLVAFTICCPNLCLQVCDLRNKSKVSQCVLSSLVCYIQAQPTRWATCVHARHVDVHITQNTILTNTISHLIERFGTKLWSIAHQLPGAHTLHMRLGTTWKSEVRTPRCQGWSLW